MERDSGFNDLLQQAEQLTADMDGNELPRVERNLRQILDAGQQLWSRTTQAVSRDTSDVKASILLGSKGYDLPKVTLKLEKLSATKTFEPIEPIRITDIEGFLKNERENAILSVIEESKKSTSERADKLFWNNLEFEWEDEKQRILNALSGSTQEIILDTTTIMGENINMRTRSSMSASEMAYAKEVYLYNEQIVQGGLKFNLAEKFYAVAKELDEKQILDLWEMVKVMTDLPLSSDKDILASRSSGLMQTAFVNQARKYLEKKYHQYIEVIVYGNLQQANMGGVPGTYYLVRSFLNIKLAIIPPGLEDGQVEGHPVWAMIYYCIRCGDIEAAVKVAINASAVLAEFVPYLKEYSQSEDHRLSPTSESQIRLMYRRSVITSTDPFKKAVYCILACCNMNDDHSEVAEKTDDYLWLKLCQLRSEEVGEGSIQMQLDRITLSQLQSLLLEDYGETHFNAYQQPFLYFEVLFLTAQFEAAIEFLSRIEHLRCHAVHLAMALYEMNLLALPTNIHAPLLSQNKADKPPMRRLNFARLIMMYTKKFEITDPREAIQYFYFLRNIRGIKEENLFISCVSELAQETNEFEMLLGKMEMDGCRKPGLIDKFHGDTKKIIEMVAANCESKGNYEDAVNVYDLAQKHDKVLELLNKLISQVVAQPSTDGSTKERLERRALEIAERYKVHGHTAGKGITQTFYLLLDLMTFFNLFHTKQFTKALATIQQLDLIPLSEDEINDKVNTFSMQAEEVRRNFPDILLATMSILYSQYKNAKSSTSPHTLSRTVGSLGEDRDQEKFIKYLRNKAQALITFAGIIPYRMPGDTNARLVQMQVLMN